MTADNAPCLTVDLNAVAANFARLQAVAGGEVAPVVKADAYGVGTVEVATRLWREGARRLFVARAEEGVALRTALGSEPWIGVFDGVVGDEAEEMARYALTPVLNGVRQLETWRSQAARTGRTLGAALQVDTGLNRLGFTGEAAAEVARTPGALSGIEVELVMTHLACADAPAHPLNARQAERFAQTAALFPRARASLTATAGLFLGPSYRSDLARPGIGLYGAGAPGHGLQAAVTLDAPILQLRELNPGDTVGYGASFTADRPMRIAILAIGYADGVLRAQGGAGYGWFANAKRALLGRISMDLTAVDVTGCDARPGARVELFGPNLSLDEAAANAGTAPYELLTRIGPRVRRHYLGAAA